MLKIALITIASLLIINILFDKKTSSTHNAIEQNFSTSTITTVETPIDKNISDTNITQEVKYTISTTPPVVPVVETPKPNLATPIEAQLVESIAPANVDSQTQNKTFSCDGRVSCGQMNSCEEATFFVKNCPNTIMDGDNDGVPCESQWCGQ